MHANRKGSIEIKESHQRLIGGKDPKNNNPEIIVNIKIALLSIG
jgi:hypothetical protein